MSRIIGNAISNFLGGLYVDILNMFAYWEEEIEIQQKLR